MSTYCDREENIDKKRLRDKQTAIGSLGSMNSTEAAPSGDIISPTTVGLTTQRKYQETIRENHRERNQEKKEM